MNSYEVKDLIQELKNINANLEKIANKDFTIVNNHNNTLPNIQMSNLKRIIDDHTIIGSNNSDFT